MVRRARVMVPRTCLRCGEAFEADIKTVQAGGAKYCCRACYSGDKGRVMEDRTCPTCGKVFNVDAKASKTYCDNACFQKSLAVTMVACRCGTCGKHFELPLGKVNHGRGKFCSRLCSVARARYRIACETAALEERKALRKVKRKLRARGLL